MLRTVLLLDGSEAMNSSSDYLPSYLLALRPPVLRFVTRYLDTTPLASLGVVVMRNGVSQRLAPLTTNASEIALALERDYFLYGGAGVTSLENGMRMALSELVDLQRVATRKSAGAAAAATTHSAVQLRVLLISASVTVIDPADVFQVLRMMANFGVVVSVVSFTGAVHVFGEAAALTGGRLYCPMNYDHLLRVMDELALSTTNGDEVGGVAAPGKKRGRHGGEAPVHASRLIPIGFPRYLHRDRVASAPATSAGAASSSVAAPTHSAAQTYLVCPQCHLLQTAVPSTCPLCRLILCSVPLLYATFVAQNHLLPPSMARPTTGSASSRRDKASKRSSPLPQSGVGAHRCALCLEDLPATVSATQCTACQSWRCASCEELVTERIGLCPVCVATK